MFKKSCHGASAEFNASARFSDSNHAVPKILPRNNTMESVNREFEAHYDEVPFHLALKRDRKPLSVGVDSANNSILEDAALRLGNKSF